MKSIFLHGLKSTKVPKQVGQCQAFHGLVDGDLEYQKRMEMSRALRKKYMVFSTSSLLSDSKFRGLVKFKYPEIFRKSETEALVDKIITSEFMFRREYGDLIPDLIRTIFDQTFDLSPSNFDAAYLFSNSLPIIAIQNSGTFDPTYSIGWNLEDIKSQLVQL